MSEPVKIVIVVNGGMVQSIGTFGVPIQAYVVDHDCEETDPERLHEIPFTGMATVLDDDGPAAIETCEALPLTPAEVAWLEGLDL